MPSSLSFFPLFSLVLGLLQLAFFFFFGSFHSSTPILQVSPLLSIFFFPTPDNYYTVVSPGRMVCSLDTPFFLIGFFWEISKGAQHLFSWPSPCLVNVTGNSIYALHFALGDITRNSIHAYHFARLSLKLTKNYKFAIIIFRVSCSFTTHWSDINTDIIEYRLGINIQPSYIWNQNEMKWKRIEKEGA